MPAGNKASLNNIHTLKVYREQTTAVPALPKMLALRGSNYARLGLN